MNPLLRRPQRHRISSFWQRWALNIGAALGSLCLIVAVLTLVFGLKPLIFVSGSMGPDIPTGSLGLALPTPVAELVPGQVVSVETTDGTRVTHRMVENRPEGLILKGDANSTADLQPYPVTSADRLLVSVPLLGYVVSWFSQPWAFFVGGLLCAYLLYLAFFRREDSQGTGNTGRSVEFGVSGAGSGPRGATDSGTSHQAWMAAGATVSVLASVMTLGTLVRVEPTRAAFSTTAEAVASPLTALSLQPALGPVQCETTGVLFRSANISWGVSALPSGARYAVRLQTSTGVYGYSDVPSATTKFAFTPSLSLLGLLNSGGNTAMPVSILVVFTVDGKPVNSTGSNIGWSTPVVNSPGRNIVYHPGFLLARSFTCT